MLGHTHMHTYTHRAKPTHTCGYILRDTQTHVHTHTDTLSYTCTNALEF